MTAPTETPPSSEYAAYYHPYLSTLPGGDIVGLMRHQAATFASLPSAAAQVHESWAYAPGKWTVREVVAHLSHTERVFGYRAFHFAHGDNTPLPGFDENAFVAASTAKARSLPDLASELLHLRQANLSFFSSLADPQWLCVGSANSFPASVRALAYIIVGHAAHHLAILRDRYKVPLDLRWPVA
jgi:hypothetical protein